MKQSPRSPDAARKDAPRAAGTGRLRSRVLVAEASPDGREALSRLFRAEGFSVVECANASDVIPFAKKHQPDVVFLDVGLKRVDAGECVRVLERFADTRSVVVVLICPRDIDANKLARLEATGALLVLVKPLTRAGLIQAFQQALAESHERKSTLETPAKRTTQTTRHVESNNSLLVRRLLCPFHETPVAVDHYVLRTGKIQTDTNFFDLPIYKSAVAGADYVDYNLLGVAVCPRCLFASNHPGYFTDPANGKDKSHAHSAATRTAIARTAGGRLQMAGELSKDFFTESRSLVSALTSYELAVHAGKTLLDCNPEVPSIELLRLGNYHLRLAHLHDVAGSGDKVRGSHFDAASDWLRRAFTVLEGAHLYKTIYQLVAVSVSFGDDRSAHRYLTRLSGLEREPAGVCQDPGSLDHYLARCSRAWEGRADHRFPWVNNALGDAPDVAVAA